MVEPLAKVIVLAGPSGAGKSHLAMRLGLPVLRLDDFYRDGTDAELPRITAGANAGLIDWDDPRSWRLDDAVACLDRLCHEGRAEVPVYDIARSGRVSTQVVDLGGRSRVVAEGIFAAEVIASCAERGILDTAWCIRQHRAITFIRRLARDLTERRKPPLVLLRRGLALTRAQPEVVRHAVARGCRPATGEQAYAALRPVAPIALAVAPIPWPVPTGFRQPSPTTCGPTSLVVARMLLSPSYAAGLAAREQFDSEVLALHRRLTRATAPGGGMQLPWPAAFGTPPWAVAAQLTSMSPGAAYRSRSVRLGRGAFGRAVEALHGGRPVALFVGSPALPRHVVLLTGVSAAGVVLFDPADGQRHLIPEADVAAGRLPRLSGWSVPWFVVSP